MIIWRLLIAGVVGKMALVTPALRADETVASAPACLVANLNTDLWKIVTLKEWGVLFKIPDNYSEETWDVVVNGAIMRSYAAGPFDRINLHVRVSSDADPERNKTRQQKEYEGFSECVEILHERKAVFQSYRGGGAIVSPEGNRFIVYHAEGLWQLKPDQLLRISGDFTTRKAQEEFLVILRTVKFL
jgi:hypothetical protein